MKYFMHKSNASSKETISELKSIYGTEGYAVYFIVLEKISAGIGEGKNTWNHSSATFSVDDWATFCLVSKKKFKKIIEFLKEKHKFFLKFEINRGVEMLTIDCPNILKHRDQYADRKAREEIQKNRTLSGKNLSLSISVSGSDKNLEIESTKDIEPIDRELNEVFNYWVSKAPERHLAFLDAPREKAIKNMLKYFSVEKLKLAIDGCEKSPFHNGSKTGEIWDNIELIFKSVSQVEMFIEKTKNQHPGNLKQGNNKYEEFLRETKDENAGKFVAIFKRAEAECRYDLTIEELMMYHKVLNGLCLESISGAFDDFHTNRGPYDGKFPKPKILLDFARQRQRGLKEQAAYHWGEVLHWIANGWRLSVMEPGRTKTIMVDQELRKQLPEKLSDFKDDRHAKEKFIELFLKTEEVEK